MIIKATVSELIDSGKWGEFCAWKGWDVWIVNEGRIDGDEVVEWDTSQCHADCVFDCKGVDNE